MAVSDRFFTSLEALKRHAADTGWFERVRTALGDFELISWRGRVFHATTTTNAQEIFRDGFDPFVKPYSALGEAVYFFWGNCDQSCASAEIYAECYYREYSKLGDQEGCILHGDHTELNILNVTPELWLRIEGVVMPHLNDVMEEYNNSHPDAALRFKTSEIERPVAWTMLSKSLPSVNGVIIDTIPPVGLYQGRSFPILGLFKPCLITGLENLKILEPMTKEAWILSPIQL